MSSFHDGEVVMDEKCFARPCIAAIAETCILLRFSSSRSWVDRRSEVGKKYQVYSCEWPSFHSLRLEVGMYPKLVASFSALRVYGSNLEIDGCLSRISRLDETRRRRCAHRRVVVRLS